MHLQVSIYLYFYLDRWVQVDTYQVVSCMVIIIRERHQTILKLGMHNYHMTKKNFWERIWIDLGEYQCLTGRYQFHQWGSLSQTKTD